MPEKPHSTFLDNPAHLWPLSPACDRGVPAPYLPLVYRAEIDGLRAIAVLAVVFFHVGLSCPGGFVGVDVFFVISGYLITALLLREFHEGRFSLAGFWERRLRRIFPAGAVMVLVTLLAGGLLLLPTDFEKLGWSAMAQSGMAANLFFWRQQGGYFADYGIQPLLHTWSLAVEEQFYVVFPLLLLLLYRKGLAKPVMLRRILCLTLTVSLILAIILLPSKSRAVFYLLPTRAWELLCGSFLATFPAAWLISPRWLREVVAWIGLAGIVLPISLYSQHTMFPGLAALPPCLGAGAIIWANMRADAAQSVMPTALGQLLALRPVVFIGLISYSLYLWHWPLLAYFSYGQFDYDTQSVATKLLIVMVCFCLAIVSWRLIELPFRKKSVAANRREIFSLAGAITAFLLILGGSIGVSGGFPFQFSKLARENDLARLDTGFSEAVTTGDVMEGRLRRLVSDVPDDATKVLLWGDSHAMHAADALKKLCHEHGCVLEVVTYPSTPPLLNEFFTTQYGLSENAPAWADAVVRHVQKAGVNNIILAASWSTYQGIDAKRLAKALRATIFSLHSASCRVWILQDVPSFGVAAPTAVFRESNKLTWPPTHDWRPTEIDHRKRNSVLYNLAAEGMPAVFIDPAPSLLDPVTGLYRADADGISLYVDESHLTSRGSHLVILPALRAAMDDTLRSSKTD